VSALTRWGKFSIVGAMGMAVQLAALALVRRWTNTNYLVASTAAIEIALLHNFAWHWYYTWQDRPDRASPLRQFVRFHLSNGLVSMLGNLALMPLFVRDAGLPVIASNLAAILCCSIANFLLGDRWVFRLEPLA
jgi:putative flippase GtrA